MRPGGLWRLVMHGPNGPDYQNKSVFVEIVPPERKGFAVAANEQNLDRLEAQLAKMA